MCIFSFWWSFWSREYSVRILLACPRPRCVIIVTFFTCQIRWNFGWRGCRRRSFHSNDMFFEKFGAKFYNCYTLRVSQKLIIKLFFVFTLRTWKQLENVKYTFFVSPCHRCDWTSRENQGSYEVWLSWMHELLLTTTVHLVCRNDGFWKVRVDFDIIV